MSSTAGSICEIWCFQKLQLRKANYGLVACTTYSSIAQCKPPGSSGRTGRTGSDGDRETPPVSSARGRIENQVAYATSSSRPASATTNACWNATRKTSSYCSEENQFAFKGYVAKAQVEGLTMAEFLDELGYPREVTKTDVVSAFLQTIQRSLNCLSAEEQKSRRNAIEKLHVCLLKDDGAGSLPPMDVLQAAWDEEILEKVLRCVSDPTEKCRELAIQLIRGVSQSLTEVDCTLKETVQVMAERMGQLPVLEDSEEIRLQLFSLLIDVLLPQCELPTLQNIIDPLHRIVAVTLHDHFHEVRKSVCSVLVTTANRDPDVFGNKTGIILKALVPCLSHSHSRVRIAVFQAIDAMVRCGLTATSVAQDLAPGTKSLAFDHTTAVRELFFASVANWLNYKARTMSDEKIHDCAVAGKVPRFHVPELLPLLLLGITDDCLDIATSTYEKLEGIGEIYKKVIDHLELVSQRETDSEKNSTPADIATQDSSSKQIIADGNLEIGGEETKLGENHLVLEDTINHPVVTNERNCANVGEHEGDHEEEEELHTAKDESTTEAVHGTCFKVYYTHPRQIESQKWRKETERPALSAEKILDTDLQLFNECKNPYENDVSEESQPKVEYKEFSEPKASGIVIEAVKSNEEESTIAGEKKGVNGLHILANEVLQENDDRKVETDVEKKATSELTDEGAVRKKDSDEAGVETLQLPKPYNGRPGAGCRLMAEAFLRPMIEPALKELKQWTTPTRLSAARLLHTLLVLAEGFAKDNLDILIPAFCSAVGDDDVKVAKRVVATIHIVGFHVPPEEWLPMVVKPLGNKKTSQAQRANVLVVTAAFLYGTPRKEMEEKHVEKICNKLYEREICCSDHTAVQNQLLSVVTNLIQVAGALCKSSSFKIFVLLLQLQSVEGDAHLQKRSGQVLEVLAQVLGMESARELYVQHIHSMLEIVTAGHEGWSSGLPGKLMFQTFMRNAKDTVGPYLESLIPMFRVCLQSDQDPALRISFLQLLDELFEKPELESSWASLAPDVIGKLLIPCGVWRASKTEAAIRYGAMVAIGTFLRRGLCSQAHMHEIMKMSEGLLPVVKTCIDEDYFLDVRRATTHVMYQFLRIYGSMLTDEQRTKLIKVLTKRMDDSSNTIRLAILPSVAMFFTTMPSSFSDSEVKDFISFLVAHMDDEHPHIQEGTCRAMEACALKKARVVLEVLRSIRSRHKSPDYLDRVVSAADCAKRNTTLQSKCIH